MKKIFLVVFVTIFMATMIFAQEEEDLIQSALPDVIPPSPEAAAFEKYIDIPVSNYTGVPNILIPLGAVQVNGITVPISLSYHASGVKVNEIAGYAGLGWSLNYGGMISRTVNGLADESGARGYYYHSKYMPLNIAGYVDGDQPYIRGILKGNYDTKPDIFSFNFPGGSGKFFFNKDKQPLLMPFQNLHVKNNNFTSWEITDQKGVAYYFETKALTINEITYTSVSSDEPMKRPFPSAWYLDKIISQDGIDTVFFEYQPDSQVRQDEETYETWYFCSATPSSHCGLSTPDDLLQRTKAYHFNPMIKEIKSRNSKVQFHFGNIREDLETGTGTVLDSIVFFDQNDIKVKKYEFVYGYFGAGSYINKRLKLERIIESGTDGQCKPPYIVEYNTSKTLPPRNSFARDHWGFYNGKTQNLTLVPEMFVAGDYIGGADRETDPEFLLAGAIEKLTYPTGGSVKFLFEPHDYGVNEVKDTLMIYEITLDNSHSNTNRPLIISENFTINGEQSLRVHLYDYHVENAIPDLNFSYIKIVNTSTNENVFEWRQAYPGYDEFMGLSPGNYRIEASVFGSDDVARIKLKFENPTDEILLKKIVGGLRIKEIRHIDPNNANKDIIKKYIYEDEDGKSSGILSKIPNYTSGLGINNPESGIPCDPGTCTYTTVSSTPKNQANITQGSHIAYSRVVELVGENGSNGKNEYKYTTKQDYPDLAGGLVSFDWRRGLLYEKTVYNKDDKKVSQTKNYYSFFESHDYSDTINTNNKIAIGMDVKQIKKTNCTASEPYICTESDVEDDSKDLFSWDGYNMVTDFIDNHPCVGKNVGSVIQYVLNQYQVSYYVAMSEWFYLDSTITISYPDEGTEIENISTYKYGNSKHIMPNQISHWNSENEIDIQQNSYALDFELDADCHPNPDECEILRRNCLDTIPNTCDECAQYVNTEPIDMQAYKNCITECTEILYPCQEEYNQCISNYDACMVDYYIQFEGALEDKFLIPLYTLNSNHIINVPVESLRLKVKDGDTLMVSGKLNIYKDFGNEVIKPHKVLKFDNTSPIEPQAAYIDANGNFIYGESDTLAIFDDYDEKGNPVQFHKLNDNPVSFIWGYNKTYPIVKATNVTHAKLEQAVDNALSALNGYSGIDDLDTFLDNIGDMTNPDNRILFQEFNENLRNHTNLRNAMVNTITYKPLIGKQTETDENGLTIYYYYDNFGRLKTIRDDDNNILSKQIYHYQE